MTHNICDHGAVGDGTALDTKAIQKAVDVCGGKGGGTVFFPPGRYLSGTVVLRSGVTLHIEAGARLVGSPDPAHYRKVSPRKGLPWPNDGTSLILAEDVEDIGLCGQGVLDGHGGHRIYMAPSGGYGRMRERPFVIRMSRCRRVRVRDLRMEDAPMWMQQYSECEDLVVSGLSVKNTCNNNNDGLDLDSCQDVRVSDCRIESWDDAICLKSAASRPCRNVTVTNCVVSSKCAAIKLGTESIGGFENIAVSNCVITDTLLGGIHLAVVDGSALDRVVVSNVTMQRVAVPIFIHLGDRGRFPEGGSRPLAGRLRRVSLSHIVATESGKFGCSITGGTGHLVEDVVLSDVRVESEGGVREGGFSREVPEKADHYGCGKMYGILPAHGLFVRHVRGLRLDGVSFACAEADARPAFRFDEVTGLVARDVDGLSHGGTSR